jgi:hypothetical protein
MGGSYDTRGPSCLENFDCNVRTACLILGQRKDGVSHVYWQGRRCGKAAQGEQLSHVVWVLYACDAFESTTY